MWHNEMLFNNISNRQQIIKSLIKYSWAEIFTQPPNKKYTNKIKKNEEKAQMENDSGQFYHRVNYFVLHFCNK